MSTLRNTGTPVRGRRIARVAAALGIAALLGGTATGCADSTTAPASPAPAAAAAPSHLLGLNIGTLVTPLKWDQAVTQQTTSAVIGFNGGTLALPSGGRLVVPRGAVLTNVTFRATQLAGDVVAYDFQPHGLVFLQPLTLQQPTAGTNFSQLPTSTRYEGAYFGSDLLDIVTGLVRVLEFEPTAVSSDRSTISISVQHFSGYMVSTGRQSAE